MEFNREYECRAWLVHDGGVLIADALLAQFAHRCFPRPLHPLGRALVLATEEAGVLRVHGLTALRPAARTVVLRGLGLVTRLGMLKGDPSENYHERLLREPEERRARHAERIARLDRGLIARFRSEHGLTTRGGRRAPSVERKAGTRPGLRIGFRTLSVIFAR
ncbi:hypothetical protein ACFWPQ_47960 [Streptomyces sp. NPDC058464]|uniref:hypothetical protein n=1 Tax=Streptomyces sp. NPDC058464 TaxID=3346511 RepID=UPI00365AACFE